MRWFAQYVPFHCLHNHHLRQKILVKMSEKIKSTYEECPARTNSCPASESLWFFFSIEISFLNQFSCWSCCRRISNCQILKCLIIQFSTYPLRYWMKYFLILMENLRKMLLQLVNYGLQSFEPIEKCQTIYAFHSELNSFWILNIKYVIFLQ